MRQTDARAIMDSGLDGVELAVALALWSFADDSGRCWPALRSLCRRSGWRERAVQRALRSLEAAQVLTVHHVPTRVTPTYVLRLASLPACAEVADDDAPADVVEGGCLIDTPGARETPPVSVVHPPVHVVHPPVSNRHPPVSVVHPNPSENPPENPPLNPPDKSMSGAAAPSPAGAGQLSLLSGQVEPSKPARPSRAAREVEAAEDLLRRLDAMRLDRHRGGRPLKPETGLPEVRRALERQTAQEVIDGWTWMLRSPEAAWHRAEDGKGTQDRTKDLKALLAHPEYAERRSWRGLEGAHEHDLEPRGEAPAVQVVTPLMAAREQRERQEEAERQAWIAEQATAPAVLPWEDIAEPEPPPAPPPPPPAAPVWPLREQLLEDRAAVLAEQERWQRELAAADADYEAAKLAQVAERRAGGTPFGPAARAVGAAQARRQQAQQQVDTTVLALRHLEARLTVEVA